MNATANLRSRLHALRDEIDAIDKELLHLLTQRALLSLEVGRVKAQFSKTENFGSTFNPQRERQVLDNLASWNMGTLPRQHIENIWHEIFSSSRAPQGLDRPKEEVRA